MKKPNTRPTRIHFFVAIHKDPSSNYGVTVPDCPGCHSGGETIPRALAHAREAIEGWVESGGTPRPPSRLSELRTNIDYAGAIWKSLSVDQSLIDRARQRCAEEFAR